MPTALRPTITQAKEGHNDFDFLTGTWDIANRWHTSSSTGSTWEEFPGDQAALRQRLDPPRPELQAEAAADDFFLDPGGDAEGWPVKK